MFNFYGQNHSRKLWVEGFWVGLEFKGGCGKLQYLGCFLTVHPDICIYSFVNSKHDFIKISPPKSGRLSGMILKELQKGLNLGFHSLKCKFAVFF